MQWCGQRDLSGGLGAACPVGSPPESDGSCAGQGGTVGFSPETADGSGAEKTVQRGGVLRWRRSSGGWGVCRRGPTARGGDGGGDAWSKRGGRRGHRGAHQGGEKRRHDGDGLFARRGHEAEERGEAGEGVLRRAREGGREGKERGGHGGDGAPIIRGHVWVQDSPWAAPRGGEGWEGAWGQCDGRVSWHGRQWPSSSARGRHTCGSLVISAKIGRGNADKWALAH
jgi:hypothetical protein